MIPAPIDRSEALGSRRFRLMVALSLVFHAALFTLGTSFPIAAIPARDTVVTVELMEEPPPDPPATQAIPEIAPAPPGAAAGSEAPRRAPDSAPARRWLEKLDDPLAERPRPDAREPDRTATLRARRGPKGPETRPDDVAAAASRLHARNGGRDLDELESRIRARRSPIVLGGDGAGASPVVNGAMENAGDPIPAAVRDMIRDRVAGYLPELEAEYSTALRLNPNLKGKLVIRIRIDARGNVARVEPVEAAVPDKLFAAAVLDRVRGWVFRPAAGFAVEVIYPFAFVAPS